jgi:SAM-dependent methyltransferase
MRSLNPEWKLNQFHARIAALAAVQAGGRVLDLGCGWGNGLPALLAAVGATGRVVGADRDRSGLDAIKAKHADAIADGQLSVVHLDFGKELPLSDASFDRVVCQNVIECIADRERLIAEMHRILRPGGTALVGHHDFDGVLIASEDRALTRHLVHGYADHTQSWQDTSDGQMGRLLPGLFAGSPFKQTKTETVLFVDLALADGTYAKQHLGDIVETAERFSGTDENAKKWLRDLQARSAAGLFYYALPWTYVIATRA